MLKLILILSGCQSKKMFRKKIQCVMHLYYLGNAIRFNFLGAQISNIEYW